MSKDNSNLSYNSRTPFRTLQLQIDDLRRKRDELNEKTKNYINDLQELETEISNTLKIAKEKYKKKRDYWNNKVKKLKEKKIEYKSLQDNFIEEKKSLQKKISDNKSSNKFLSIKQIERKIENLERRIEIENLDIIEENAIVDKIKNLAEMKQKLLLEQGSNDLFRIERKLEIVKINLNKIYEQLNKWSNKSQENHAKMLEVYQKVDYLREKKKVMEEDLIDNKKKADQYHEQYLKLMNQKKKLTRGRKPYRQNRKLNLKIEEVNKKQEMIEKIKQDKLALALEKQKAGKKLNLFEARLILEKSKR